MNAHDIMSDALALIDAAIAEAANRAFAARMELQSAEAELRRLHAEREKLGPIQSRDHAGRVLTLRHSSSGRPVYHGEAVADFRGNMDNIKGGTAPHKRDSSGRVQTQAGAEFGPSVFGLMWAE